jgi:DNA-binding beta-propeller fold protein YncE
MRLSALVYSFMLGGLLLVAAAWCETVEEAWRSPFGNSYAISVAPDGTAWAASGASVLQLASDGSLLKQINGFRKPVAIAAAPDNGCWVCDQDAHTIVRVGPDGQETWRRDWFSRPWAISVNSEDGSGWIADIDWGVFHISAAGTVLANPPLYFPKSVSVNSSDGSCWVAGGGDPLYAYVVRVDEGGNQVAAGTGFIDPISVAADPLSGKAWVIDNYAVIILDDDGSELGRQSGLSSLASVSVDNADGTGWIANSYAHEILHVSLGETGADILLDKTTVYAPGLIAPSPLDHSCWIPAGGGIQFFHMSAEGTDLWSATGICFWPSSISTNISDGSAWVSSPLWNSVTHVGVDGETLWQGWDFYNPKAVSANSSDGSCWVADTLNYEVAHLDSEGSELWRGNLGDQPSSVSVNPADDSCWVASEMYSHITHLSSSGSVMWEADTFSNPRAVSVNSSDNSCWVTDYGNGQVVHLAASGAELFRGGDFYLPYFLSVNPADGSVWVSDADGNTVAHLASNSEEMWRSPETYLYDPGQPSVNPVDGSCWVPLMTSTEVIHLSARGHEKWRGGYFMQPESVSVNPADGSCWVADTRNNQLVLLAVIPAFEDAGYGFWAADYIEACVEAGIVFGYDDGTYRPENQVGRDQMAVYLARGVAGGDDNVPEGPTEASFPDVPVDYWAFKYVEYTKQQNIITGYADGLFRPADTVDRGQMAVFMARSIAPYSERPDLPGYTPPETPRFADVPADFWAYKFIEYIAQPSVAVTHGFADGRYHPELLCTRDQMAVYIARSFHLGV